MASTLATAIICALTNAPAATGQPACDFSGWTFVAAPDLVAELLNIEIDNPSSLTISRPMLHAPGIEEPEVWANVAGTATSTPTVYFVLRGEPYYAGEDLVSNDSLAHHARKLGGSHFAWFQVVVESPWHPVTAGGSGRLVAPMVDPSPGGYANDTATRGDDSVRADTLPWYWNHALAPDYGHDACVPHYTNAVIDRGKMFVLSDSPSFDNPSLFQTPFVFRFHTYLALLNADESLLRFIPCKFTWSQTAPPRDPLAPPVYTTVVESFFAGIPPADQYPGLLVPEHGPAFTAARVKQFGEVFNFDFTQPLVVDPNTGEIAGLKFWTPGAATNADGQGSGSVVPNTKRSTAPDGESIGHLTGQLQTHQLTGFPGSIPPSPRPTGTTPGVIASWITQSISTHVSPFLVEIDANLHQPGAGNLRVLLDGVSIGAVTTDEQTTPLPLYDDGFTTLRFLVDNPALLGRTDVSLTIVLEHLGTQDLRLDLDAVRTIPSCSPSDIAGPGQTVGYDGSLTADDIIVFLNWFFASDIRADVAGPGQSTVTDGQFTADDIIVFLNRFFSGC